MLLLCVGCAGQNKAADTTAVDKTLLEAFGKPGDEAVKALGLTDEMQIQEGHYVCEYKWCGLPMETELGMNFGGTGVFGYVAAEGLFEDNADTVKTARMCFDKFAAQLGDPYAYIAFRETKLLEKTAYDPAQLDAYFDQLASGGTGDGIQFRFSLMGKNDRLSDDSSYLDCYFQKPEYGRIRFQFVMTWVDRGAVG